MNKVFFYGTLMTGQGNHHIVEGHCLGRACTLNRYQMRCCGIPALFHAFRAGVVHGEVWELTESSLRNVRALEGGYIRIEDWVRILGTGEKALVELYVQDGDPNQWGELVPTGDFRDTQTQIERCPECGNEIDPDMCWCGGSIDGHGYYDNHSPVPLGCDCGRATQQPRKEKHA